VTDVPRIDVASWELPSVFKWLKQAGNVSATEMGRTFNTGVGMVAVVKKEHVEQVITELETLGEEVYLIGQLVPRTAEGCILKGLESWN
jgi:phosphoribosylamine--glycine ligase/phosphoribosylformylglycinamidine cyclo-ligase